MDPLVNYTKLTSGLSAGQVANVNQILNNLSAIENSINPNNEHDRDQDSFKQTFEKLGSYIRFFDVSKVSTGTNTITISAGATTFYDASNSEEVVGWASSGSVSVSAYTEGYIWAIYPGKTYAVSNLDPANEPSNAYRVASFVNSAGTVTVTALWQNPIESRDVVLEEDLVVNKTLKVYGNTTLKNVTLAGSVTNNDPAGYLPSRYASGGTCTYNSTSQLSVSPFTLRNHTDDGDIIKATSTTVDITATGLNGIAQSDNLTGTISVTASSTTVTGSGTAFTTDFVVGDVIKTVGNQYRRIDAIASNTSMTVDTNFSSSETNVTYKRGGRANNTPYILYAITNGATVGCMLSTRNVSAGDTLVDLPSGYTKYRQLDFGLVLNSSGNIINFVHIDGWTHFPGAGYDDSTAGTRVLNGVLLSQGGQFDTVYNSFSLRSFVPRGVKNCNLVVNGSYKAFRNEVNTNRVYMDNGLGLTDTLDCILGDNRIMYGSSGGWAVHAYIKSFNVRV